MTPDRLFSLGCGPFLFRKKEMVCKKTHPWPGTSPNPFLFGGPKKKRFRAAKEKGPAKDWGRTRLLPAPGNDVKKPQRYCPPAAVPGDAFAADSNPFGAPSRGAKRRRPPRGAHPPRKPLSGRA